MDPCALNLAIQCLFKQTQHIKYWSLKIKIPYMRLSD
jgi:hypothetical protein